MRNAINPLVSAAVPSVYGRFGGVEGDDRIRTGGLVRSSPDSTLDRALHLSLPDWRTALKRRARRPRRPSGWRLFWLVYTVFYAGLTVWAWVDGLWFTVAADLGAVAYGWWAFSTWQRGIVWRYYAPLLAVLWAQMVLVWL